MNSYKKLSVQVARWVDVLQQYDYSFRHGPEIQMKHERFIESTGGPKGRTDGRGHINCKLLCVYNMIVIRTSHSGPNSG